MTMKNPRIGEALDQSGKPDAEAARACGITRSAMGHHRHGRRAASVALLEALARFCGVRFEWLALGTGPMRDAAASANDGRVASKRRRAPPASAAPRHPRARNAA